MAPISILFHLVIAITFLSCTTTKAQGPNYLYQFCSTNKTTTNSTFQSNLRTLFSSLSSNATANNDFHNSTVTGRNSSDTVYGLFMCRGDTDTSTCSKCVANVTQKLSSDSECSLSKQAVSWYDECMVRYSNRSFFSTADTRPGAFLFNTANVSNQESFMSLLFATMNDTADEAASFSGGAKYATKEANISGFQSLYCLAQCTEDLPRQECRRCLEDAIGNLPRCCEGKQGGRVLYPSCNIRYELYPFYQSPASAAPAPSPAGIVPPTTSSSSGGNVI